MLKPLFLAVALLLLRDCSHFGSGGPMIAADEAAPPLRPGVWRSAPDDCGADEWTTPPTAGCVSERIGEHDHGWWSPDRGWSRAPYVLGAKGQVQVMQVLDPEWLTGFAYYGVRVLNRDDEGRAVRIRRWEVRCGPARKRQGGARGALVQPASIWPNWCVPTDRRGLQKAVEAAEPRAGQGELMFWVRERPRREGEAGPPPLPVPQSTIEE